jgi:hypothetical protein
MSEKTDGNLRIRTIRPQLQTMDLQAPMHEISSLLDIMTTELSQQSDTLQSIVDDTESSRDYITKGNRQLQELNERPNSFRDITLILIGIFTFIIIFLDWYTP